MILQSLGTFYPAVRGGYTPFGVGLVTWLLLKLKDSVRAESMPTIWICYCKKPLCFVTIGDGGTHGSSFALF